MNKDLLIIFAKNPELGKVKTRLASDIGEEKALAIYYKLLNHTRKVSAPAKADKAIFYDMYIDTEDEWQKDVYKKALQEGKDLGERMYNAMMVGKSWGYKKVGIIGTDIYDLTTEIIDHAFSRLTYHDWVFGPAKDGGYYFAGCHEPVPEVFDLQAWSHDLVLKQTLEKAYDLELSVSLIEELNDIDTVEDLKGTDLEVLLRSI
jgi:rSAM/selenodomain-associated transferase 1